MSNHRNPQASVSKQAPSDNFNPSDKPHLVGYIDEPAVDIFVRPLEIPFIPDEQLTLDRTVLIELLEHAASAARIVGHLDDAIAAGPLGDHVDAVVHGLTELLGDPRTLAGPDGGGSDDRVVDEATHARVQPYRPVRHPPDFSTTAAEQARVDDRQARGHRVMSRECAGASRWWGRGAPVAGLIVLVGLVLRVLGSCGGAR